MSDVQPSRPPRTAPPALQAHVRSWLAEKGLKVRDTGATVVPFVQGPRPRSMRNPFIDPSEPRWVARCPECPGAEVVGDGLFVCGSCGASADVAWDEVR